MKKKYILLLILIGSNLYTYAQSEKNNLSLQEYSDFENYLGKDWDDCIWGSTLLTQEWNVENKEYNKHISFSPKKHPKVKVAFVPYLKVVLGFNKGICTTVFINNSRTTFGKDQTGDYTFIGEKSQHKKYDLRLYHKGEIIMTTIKVYDRYVMFPYYNTKYFLFINGKNKKYKKFKRNYKL